MIKASDFEIYDASLPITTASSTSQSVFSLPFGIIIGSYGPTIAELDLKKEQVLLELPYHSHLHVQHN